MLEKIIDSFEKLCIQIIIEMILVPITIYKLFYKSSRCYEYAVLEMTKDDTERFKDILSPIKLSLYTSVIVSVLLIDYGGQTSFISKISGLNMVEKALILFMISNLTAILFSLFLLRYKSGKVNSLEFRTLLFSFIYASAYTNVPQFILVLSMIAVGQTANIEKFIEGVFISSDSVNGKLIVITLAFIVCFVLLIIGLIKLFKAYTYILKAYLPYRSYLIYLFSVVFFAIQLCYLSYFL